MIRSIIFLCTIFFSLSGCHEKPLKDTSPFFENGGANHTLLTLGKLTNTPLTHEDSLETLTQKTQKAWYQKGKERWEMTLSQSIQEKSIDEIIRLCKKETHADEDILPNSSVHYDGVLFLGAAFPRIVKRLDFYLNLIQKGQIKDNTPLYVLSGERSLNSEAGETKENFEKIVNTQKAPIPFPKNETEMIQFVFYHRFPDHIQPHFIHSLKHHTAKRATTDSTFETFLKEKNIKKGHFLCISSQPFVYYQETALKAKLHKLKMSDIHITCIGEKMNTHDLASKSNQAAILLDNTAKILYNIAQTHK